MLDFKVHTDQRGKLAALQEGDIPFAPVRTYYYYDMRAARGCHVHHDLQQVFVCLHGTCTVRIDDARHGEYRLESPAVGLYVRGMRWVEVCDFSEGCVLMVLANAAYDKSDYVSDYDEFRRIAEGAAG